MWMFSIGVFLHNLVHAMGWHAYDKALFEKLRENPTCKEFFKDLTPSHDTLHDYGLWDHLLTKQQAKSGQTLIGFRQAIKLIHENQNPVDCKNKKFLIPHSSFANGFGSQHHVNGVGLAVAMK